ncbi:hypothetical protein [Paraburkholderia aromaticivorans]|nr:hypothetical protein [Paraburkholderia aromaticivorans]
MQYPQVQIPTDSKVHRDSRQFPVLSINGRLFGHLDEEPVTGGAGFYRHTSRGITLYKGDRMPFAYAVANDRQGYFFVTAHMTNEGVRYMFSTCSSDANYLGIHDMSCREESELASGLRKQIESFERGRAVMKAVGELQNRPQPGSK